MKTGGDAQVCGGGGTTWRSTRSVGQDEDAQVCGGGEGRGQLGVQQVGRGQEGDVQVCEGGGAGHRVSGADQV